MVANNAIRRLSGLEGNRTLSGDATIHYLAAAVPGEGDAAHLYSRHAAVSVVIVASYGEKVHNIIIMYACVLISEPLLIVSRKSDTVSLLSSVNRVTSRQGD
jgi:hypothetical protein